MIRTGTLITYNRYEGDTGIFGQVVEVVFGGALHWNAMTPNGDGSYRVSSREFTGVADMHRVTVVG